MNPSFDDTVESVEIVKSQKQYYKPNIPLEDPKSVLVLIIQGETRPCNKNIENLKWIFSDPYFIVQVCDIEIPPDIPISRTLSRNDYIENYYMRKALDYAAEGPYTVDDEGNIIHQKHWHKLPCIIIKDSSVSNVTPSGETFDDQLIGGMKRRISVALEKAKQADLFYLCTWSDRCDKFIDVKGVGSNIDHGSTLKWSISPSSNQAIMYRPATRDYVKNVIVGSNSGLSNTLNNLIQQGKLLAVVFVPNIVDYDITLATNNSDYLKLNQCAPIPSVIKSNSSTIIWVILVFSLVFLAAWGLINVGPAYSKTPE